MKKLLIVSFGIFIFLACKTQRSAVADLDVSDKIGEIDPESGLVIDQNLMYVKAHCTSCHSAKLVTMNRFTREGWKDKITWMQKYQGLWDLGEAEPLVLDYLEKHYAPVTQQARRKNLEGVEWYELKN